MYLGQEYKIAGDWFVIHFTENNGMAFGIELFGKKFLSIFRIIVAIGLAWYLKNLVTSKAHPVFITAMSMIFAGAVGNIIDSIFYGKIFSGSELQVAQFLPADGGYETWLHGKVVDMFYFPIIETHFPTWFPVWGGEEFIFFRPVFNIADSSISLGVLLIVLFQSAIFKNEKKEEVSETSIVASESKNASV